MRMWIVGLVAAVLLVSVPASARVHVWIGVPTVTLPPMGYTVGWGPFYSPAWPPYTPVYPYPSYPSYQSYPMYSAPPPVPMFTAPEPVWYYCDGLGYYPYINQCPGGWRQVPARPQ
jgi:hypothetical protein